MTGYELAERRSQLGLTVERLATDLNRHVDEVRRWETVSGKLPRSLERELDWQLANTAREQAMERSGLPPCPWAEAKVKEINPKKSESLERVVEELEEHYKTCDICQRRAAFAATLPPLPRPPMSLTVQAIVTVSEAIRRLPKWLRPAATGAVLLGGLTLLRAAAMLVISRGADAGQALLAVLAALGIGAYGGAVGGLVYGLVSTPARQRFGKGGPYLTGLACMHALVAAFGIPYWLFANDDTFRSTWALLFWLAVATVIGLAIGHSWFREKPKTS